MLRENHNKKNQCVSTTQQYDIFQVSYVDAPANDGNASMPEQVKRPNPWMKKKKKMMMMMMMMT